MTSNYIVAFIFSCTATLGVILAFIGVMNFFFWLEKLTPKQALLALVVIFIVLCIISLVLYCLGM